MRVSTQQFFSQNIRAMLDRQEEVSKTQQQLSTGRRILEPGDDPAGAARLLEIRQQIAGTEQYQRNIGQAMTRLEAEETALAESGNLLVRVRELAVQGLNDTLNDGDRESIALEVRQLTDQLQELANSKDGHGDYVFAGYRTDTVPFERGGTPPYARDGSEPITYQGGVDQQREIQAGPSRRVTINDSGDQVFTNIARPGGGSVDLFASLDRLVNALETPAPNQRQEMNESLDEIIAGQDHLLNVRAEVGSRMNALEDQEGINDAFRLSMEQVIAEVEGLDFPAAAARLSQQLTSLQSTQQSFAKIQGLSLFNYL